MIDYSHKLEALPEPYQRVYESLYQAAHLGNPCPMNRELAAICGFPNATPRYVTEVVRRLEADGLIRVERGRTWRVVILPSGHSTMRKMHEAEEVLPPASDNLKLGLGGGPPMPPGPRVDRTPCFRCGVRADIGCAHGRRWAEAA